MSDIIAMHRADLVDAVTVAVQPLKARITELETSLETWKNDATTYHQRAWNAEGRCRRCRTAAVGRFVKRLIQSETACGETENRK